MKGAIVMTFSQRLQNLRKKSGMTQEVLAEQLNITRQTISKWERGESAPDFEYLIQISDLFHVTTDYLLKGELPQDEQPASLDRAATVLTGKQTSHALSLLGGCLFLGGLITNIVLLVLSVFYDMNWTGNIGHHIVRADGLMGFLLWKNLVWLFALMCLAIVIGFLLLILSFVKPHVHKKNQK